jgi:hypothetical protein
MMNALDRTIDAVLIDAETVVVSESGAGLRLRLERLRTSAVDIALVGDAEPSSLTTWQRSDPAGLLLIAALDGSRLYELLPDGPTLRDSGPASDGGGWHVALRALLARGIAPAGVLLLVDGTSPASLPTLSAPGTGPGNPLVLSVHDADALDLLDEQVRRRSERRVPPVTEDPGWTVSYSLTHGHRAHAVESVLSVGDGEVVTRGVMEEDIAGPCVLAGGIYTGEGSAQHLLPGPGWTALSATGPRRGQRRLLDLRTGVLLREETTGTTPLRTLRFASAARPGLQVLRAEGAPARIGAGPALYAPTGTDVEIHGDDGLTWATAGGEGGGIVAVAAQHEERSDERRVVERLAVYRTDPARLPDVDPARAALRAATRAGFDTLLAEHRRVWARRWESVDVEIPDDPSAQVAFRYAIFQLWTNAGVAENATSSSVERAVGARGLAGTGYAGHVFWDADVFVLPALAMICPPAARAMVEYRIRRLPQACAGAASSGRDGARFPWESARDGVEVTPHEMMLGTELVKILTGDQEEHITADVAWAADRYTTWTGDPTLIDGPGRPLILETARYWASRVRRSDDGRAHVDHVIGPDEYHEDVDDNAFTNIIARWNLRRAAALVADDDPAQAVAWREVADALVDGYSPQTGRHEQFAGYDELESLLVAGIAPIPFAADLMLGRERVHRSQLIKQADVLMAHFLVPQEVPEGSLQADLDFYVPRTSHGSSLSPAITAGLLARAGRADEALEMLRMALRLDLDDVTGTSAGGLHIATIGGVWQALVTGVLGLSVSGGVLGADPHLPAAWGSVGIRLHCLGARIRVHVAAEELTISTDRPLRAAPHGCAPVEIRRTATFRPTGDGGWAPAS